MRYPTARDAPRFQKANENGAPKAVLYPPYSKLCRPKMGQAHRSCGWTARQNRKTHPPPRQNQSLARESHVHGSCKPINFFFGGEKSRFETPARNAVYASSCYVVKELEPRKAKALYFLCLCTKRRRNEQGQTAYIPRGKQSSVCLSGERAVLPAPAGITPFSTLPVAVGGGRYVLSLILVLVDLRR